MKKLSVLLLAGFALAIFLLQLRDTAERGSSGPSIPQHSSTVATNAVDPVGTPASVSSEPSGEERKPLDPSAFLSTEDGGVEVIVLDRDDTPVIGAVVASNSKASSLPAATTNSDGRAVLSERYGESGSFWVRAEADGFHPGEE